MDNRINDKDLEFVTGGSAATTELEIALEELRWALSLFTDDMPESARTMIAHTADVIDEGDTEVFIFIRSINTAIDELKSFMNTLAGNPDKCRMVQQVLYHLNSALDHLNL